MKMIKTSKLVILLMMAAGVRADMQLFMPEVQPDQPGLWLCSAFEVKEDNLYITGFKSNLDQETVHHIALYACTGEPVFPEGEVWNLIAMGSNIKSSKYEQGPLCHGQEKIIFVATNGKTSFQIPTGASIGVGKASGFRYIVLEVHYYDVSKYTTPENSTDSSGVTLLTTKTPTPQHADIYWIMSVGYIPAGTTEYFESACEHKENIELFPFAFRVHAHGLGTVTSVYRIRNGEWALIGQRDTRDPQMFYLSEEGVTIQKGDIIASRCTHVNTRNSTVVFGPYRTDEMCGIYIMYYAERLLSLENKVCFKASAPYWFWKDYPDQSKMNLQAMPATVSVVPGTSEVLVRTATDVIDESIFRYDEWVRNYTVQEVTSLTGFHRN